MNSTINNPIAAIVDRQLSEEITAALSSSSPAPFSLPSDEQLNVWVNHTLSHPHVINDVVVSQPSLQQAELSIRLVDHDESRTLNRDYRQKDKPTNVLSFPADLPDIVDLPLLGDLIICVPVVQQEAIDQHKAADDHWAHMVIHGTLHLLGYDHIEEPDAILMESIETDILSTLGIACPYT
ncbi:rRNA maturation RNase YbeY [Eionea flava]